MSFLDKEALKIHGYIDSSDDSENAGSDLTEDSDWDEKYSSLKPPPVPMHLILERCVRVKAFENLKDFSNCKDQDVNKTKPLDVPIGDRNHNNQNKIIEVKPNLPSTSSHTEQNFVGNHPSNLDNIKPAYVDYKMKQQSQRPKKAYAQVASKHIAGAVEQDTNCFYSFKNHPSQRKLNTPISRNYRTVHNKKDVTESSISNTKEENDTGFIDIHDAPTRRNSKVVVNTRDISGKSIVDVEKTIRNNTPQMRDMDAPYSRKSINNYTACTRNMSAHSNIRTSHLNTLSVYGAINYNVQASCSNNAYASSWKNIDAQDAAYPSCSRNADVQRGVHVLHTNYKSIHNDASTSNLKNENAVADTYAVSDGYNQEKCHVKNLDDKETIPESTVVATKITRSNQVQPIENEVNRFGNSSPVSESFQDSNDWCCFYCIIRCFQCRND